MDITAPIVGDWGLYEKAVPIKGRGVFPTKRIPAEQLVLKFEGPIFTKETCPDFSEAIQVGLNAWMWSSGGLDDLVNHACTPNLGLYPLAGNLYLRSLRVIELEEELSFDYSTSMVDEPWSMECACGEGVCRGKIANFLDLPESTQRWYAERGVVPEHVAHAYRTRGAGCTVFSPSCVLDTVPVCVGSPDVLSTAECDTEGESERERGPTSSPSTASTASGDDTPPRSVVSEFSTCESESVVRVPNPVSSVVGDWGLYLKPVEVKGKAVFAGVDIPPNRLVLKFEGPIFTKETCPDFSEAIQVGLNAWMWSSGGLDDYVNHACNPNLGLYPLAGNLYLLSLRPIAAGEELSFDYSTSMVDEPWDMECACGEEACRGKIGNFLELPESTQRRYAELGVLPEHVEQAYRTRGYGAKHTDDLASKLMAVTFISTPTAASRHTVD